MTDVDLDRVEGAWRGASDSDIVRALSTPGDYEYGVLAVIQREAERRHLKPADRVGAPPRNRAKVTRLWHVIQTYLSAHRCVAAALHAVLVGTCGVFFTPSAWLGRAWPIWSAALIAAYLAGLGAAAWPLRDYRIALKVCAAAAACFAALGAVNFAITFREDPRMLTMGVLMTPLNFVGVAGISSLILCGIVFVRIRYWPVYPPGHCVACGYDLTGNVTGACSECGEDTPGSTRASLDAPSGFTQSDAES